MTASNRKGSQNELDCIAYLHSIGCDISVPLDALRYDFIIDYQNHLYRIQAKAGKFLTDENTFYVPLTSGNKSRVKKYEDSEIDYFATFFNEKCYLIPKNGLDQKYFTLRTAAPKNNQNKSIHLAKDFAAEVILDT